jgi:hypothetical protein
MEKSNVVKMQSTLEMLGFLKTNGTACRFVAIVSKTPVVKIKTNNPFGELFKVSTKIGIINADYNKSVRTRIADTLGVKLSEVEYENGKVWYEHLQTSDGKNLPLVQHKNESKRDGYYIQYYPHKSSYVYTNSQGEVIPTETVKPYLYAETERAPYKPNVIVIKLANVCQLKASGVVIEMPNFEEAETVLAD